MQPNPKQFSKKLLAWFDQHGRKNLPWQKPRTPYHVWLSEIMLQQTQVSTVIPYFLTFIKKFPTIKKLANAPLDEVLTLWSGLGYYARARNLHRTAQIIQQQYQGKFPEDLELLQQLPGIGRSTAGAILALSMQQRATILDGNVKRVLSRYQAINGERDHPDTLKKLWALAESYTPHERIADYTQAIMDLGATVCTRSKPNCSQCPFVKNCLAYQQGNPTAYPQAKISKKIPERSIRFLILRNSKGEILLEKRPPVGIWGGLWSLPECAIDEDMHDFCLKKFGHKIKTLDLLPQIWHTFTHFKLQITPVLIEIDKTQTKIMEAGLLAWHDVSAKQQKGLPTPIKKILAFL